MTRLTLLLIILILALGSCGIPSENSKSGSEGNFPTITATHNPTDTPPPTITMPVPTHTPTEIHTGTPTATTQPTVTQHLPEFYSLPLLIASQPISITHINMIDTVNGWAIGHQINSGDRILYTQDGGYSWDERTPPVSRSSEKNAGQFRAWGHFYDAQTAWAIYLPKEQPPPIDPSVIWRTTDGGQTWEASEPLPLTGAESFFIPEAFSFVDPNQGWLLVHIDAGMSHDYSNLYTTSDGGHTWLKLIDPYGEGLQSLHNTGLAFAGSNLGWVTKDNLAVMPGAFIEQTRDGGLTWEDIFLPEPDELNWFKEIVQCATSSPIFLENTRGIVLVNCQTFDDNHFTYTYISSDQGQSWHAVTLPSPAQSLFFIDNHIGWALGRDLYQSTDGGLSWVKIKTVNWDGQFSFVNQKFGWAVAIANESIALVFTQDGGRTWQLIEPTIQE